MAQQDVEGRIYGQRKASWYNALDQGAGMIDVAGALKAFKTRLRPLSSFA